MRGIAAAPYPGCMTVPTNPTPAAALAATLTPEGRDEMRIRFANQKSRDHTALVHGGPLDSLALNEDSKPDHGSTFAWGKRFGDVLLEAVYKFDGVAWRFHEWMAPNGLKPK